MDGRSDISKLLDDAVGPEDQEMFENSIQNQNPLQVFRPHVPPSAPSKEKEPFKLSKGQEEGDDWTEDEKSGSGSDSGQSDGESGDSGDDGDNFPRNPSIKPPTMALPPPPPGDAHNNSNEPERPMGGEQRAVQPVPELPPTQEELTRKKGRLIADIRLKYAKMGKEFPKHIGYSTPMDVVEFELTVADQMCNIESSAELGFQAMFMATKGVEFTDQRFMKGKYYLKGAAHHVETQKSLFMPVMRDIVQQNPALMTALGPGVRLAGLYSYTLITYSQTQKRLDEERREEEKRHELELMRIREKAAAAAYPLANYSEQRGQEEYEDEQIDSEEDAGVIKYNFSMSKLPYDPVKERMKQEKMRKRKRGEEAEEVPLDEDGQPLFGRKVVSFKEQTLSMNKLTPEVGKKGEFNAQATTTYGESDEEQETFSDVEEETRQTKKKKQKKEKEVVKKPLFT